MGGIVLNVFTVFGRITPEGSGQKGNHLMEKEVMKKDYISKSFLIFIATFLISICVYPVEAKSLKKGEVYRSLDGKTIEVISKNELEITKRGEIILANYSFKGDKLRIVFTILGTKRVKYLELTKKGLRGKSGEFYYSKAYSVADVTKWQLRTLAVAMESYYVIHDTYTTDISKLREEYGHIYIPDQNVIVTIKHADKERWVATARHKRGGETLTWDSSKGGMQ